MKQKILYDLIYRNNNWPAQQCNWHDSEKYLNEYWDQDASQFSELNLGHYIKHAYNHVAIFAELAALVTLMDQELLKMFTDFNHSFYAHSQQTADHLLHIHTYVYVYIYIHIYIYIYIYVDIDMDK